LVLLALSLSPAAQVLAKLDTKVNTAITVEIAILT